MTQSLLVIIKGQPRYVTYVLNVCSIQNFLNMRERERERERDMKNTYYHGPQIKDVISFIFFNIYHKIRKSQPFIYFIYFFRCISEERGGLNPTCTLLLKISSNVSMLDIISIWRVSV